MNRSYRNLLGAAVIALCAPMLSGCLLPLVAGGAAAGGYAAGGERGLNGTVSDASIKAEINVRWLQTNREIPTYVDLNVFQGRVLLTGGVPNPGIRDQAVAEAWKVEGVQEVLDEIHVTDKSTFGSTARDNFIQTELRGDLVLDRGIASGNYSLQTVDGVVYILGSARSQEELDKVLNYARNISDVKKVVNYVRIRSGVGERPVAGQPAANPPAPPPPIEAAPNYNQPDSSPPADSAEPFVTPPDTAPEAPAPSAPTQLAPPANTPGTPYTPPPRNDPIQAVPLQ